VLGWEHHIVTNDIAASQVGFIGIAVALLGRNSAIGILLAALLFGGLEAGTSTRALDATIFPPQLASNLAVIIQGLIVLFIGAQLLLVYAWRLRRHKREPQITAPSEKVSPI
jgi:simple sugar transport system permease protein